MTARFTSWDVLLDRNMRWYLTGNVCSNIGTWLQNTAQILLAFHLTDSVVGVGMVVGAQFAGPFIFAPWAGALADRINHRDLLVATHLASAAIAVAVAGLQFTGLLTHALLVAGAFGIGAAYTFTLPALSAFIPRLVPATRTREAMALNNASFNVGRALAPVLGIGVITTVGFAWAFVLNAISFVVLAAVFFALRPRPLERDTRPPRLLDGVRIAVRERRILVVMVLVVFGTVATDPLVVLGPALARDLFRVPALWSAYFLAAFGAGTVVGSLLPAAVRSSLRGAAIYLGILGGAVVLFTATGNVWVGLGAAVVAGGAFLRVGTATQTLLLRLSGPHRSGRVMAVWALAFAGSRPVATALDTWLTGAFGARAGAILLASPAFLMGGVILCLQGHDGGYRRALRTLGEDESKARPPISIYGIAPRIRDWWATRRGSVGAAPGQSSPVEKESQLQRVN